MLSFTLFKGNVELIVSVALLLFCVIGGPIMSYYGYYISSIDDIYDAKKEMYSVGIGSGTIAAMGISMKCK